MKHINEKILLFLIISFFSACSNENAPRNIEPDAPLITGFEFHDVYGNPIGQSGHPNIKTKELKNGLQYYLTAYPNPTFGELAIYFSGSAQPGTPTRIWITAARTDLLVPQFNFAGSTSVVISGQPLIKLDNLPPNANLRADLSNLPAGAYRVYAQFGDVLLWDNILLQK